MWQCCDIMNCVPNKSKVEDYLRNKFV